MLYDFISESVSLQEQELLEDKMVKFGGELSPKFDHFTLRHLFTKYSTMTRARFFISECLATT